MTTRQAVLVSRTKAINELKSLIVVAPEDLRSGLRGQSLLKQLDFIELLTSPAGATVEHRVTVLMLRSITARIRFLLAQTAELDPELLALVKQHPAGPTLLAEPGVGPVVAAQLLVSWSTAAVSAARRHSPHSPASHRWKQAVDNEHDTVSTAAGTEISTGHCMSSPSPGSAATPNRATTRPSEPRKARPTAMSGAHSNALLPAGSTAGSRRQLDRQKQLQSTSLQRLDIL